jgi:hypothetical protein
MSSAGGLQFGPGAGSSVRGIEIAGVHHPRNAQLGRAILPYYTEGWPFSRLAGCLMGSHGSGGRWSLLASRSTGGLLAALSPGYRVRGRRVPPPPRASSNRAPCCSVSGRGIKRGAVQVDAARHRAPGRHRVPGGPPVRAGGALGGAGGAEPQARGRLSRLRPGCSGGTGCLQHSGGGFGARCLVSRSGRSAGYVRRGRAGASRRCSLSGLRHIVHRSSVDRPVLPDKFRRGDTFLRTIWTIWTQERAFLASAGGNARGASSLAAWRACASWFPAPMPCYSACRRLDDPL